MSTNDEGAAPRPRRRVRGWMYVIAGLLIVSVVGTLGVRWYLSPPGSPPAYTGPRPAEADGGYVVHTETLRLDVPVGVYRQWAKSDVGLEDLNVSTEGGPSVVGTAPIIEAAGPDDQTGFRRRVNLSDGHFIAEEILADKPEVFRYMIWGFTNYGKLMVDHAIGEFQISGDDTNTELVWSYSFQPRNPLLRPILDRFVRDTWSGMMRTTTASIHDSVVDFAGSRDTGQR